MRDCPYRCASDRPRNVRCFQAIRGGSGSESGLLPKHPPPHAPVARCGHAYREEVDSDTSTMSEPGRDWRRRSARWTPRHTRRSCPCAGLFDGRYWARTSPPHSGHGWTGLASAVGERMVEPHAGSQRWTGAATSDAPVRCECGRDVDGVRVGIRSTGPERMNKRRQQLAALGS
jgi:hypothetical protein